MIALFYATGIVALVGCVMLLVCIIADELGWSLHSRSSYIVPRIAGVCLWLAPVLCVLGVLVGLASVL